jgi:hypothetical protein
MLRRLRSCLAVGVVASVLVMTTSTAAHASLMQRQDGFEINPHGSWLTATGGAASAGFDINAGTARSGANNGWLFATNGWAFAGHWVPTSSVPASANCAAQTYFQASGPTQVGIEIWDAHNNLLFGTAPAINGTGYVNVDTPRWSLRGANPVFVKAIIGSNGPARFVRIDDMALQCHW